MAATTQDTSKLDRRGTLFPRSKYVLPVDNPPNALVSLKTSHSAAGAGQKRKVPEDSSTSPGRERAKLGPRLPIIIERTSIPLPVVEADPFLEHFVPFLKINEAGPALLAYRNKEPTAFSIVVIRTAKLPSESSKNVMGRLVNASHQNVVHLEAAYYHEQTFHLVYEPMDVSLSQVQSSPKIPSRPYEIAAICKEVRSFSPISGVSGLTHS